MPFEAAKRVIEDKARYTWFSDRPKRPFSDAGIDLAEIDALFAARKTAKGDLKYLGERLPSPANMPDPETVRAWHLDLIAAQDLAGESAASEPLIRRAIATLGLDKAAVLSEGLQRLASNISSLQAQPWAWALTEAIIGEAAAAGRLEPVARAFFTDARGLVERRAPFISKPVSTPKGITSRETALSNSGSPQRRKKPIWNVGLRSEGVINPRLKRCGLRACGQARRTIGSMYGYLLSSAVR